MQRRIHYREGGTRVRVSKVIPEISSPVNSSCQRRTKCALMIRIGQVSRGEDASVYSTPEALREIRRLQGISLPRPTLIRWIKEGIARPSLRRSRGGGRGHAHEWSAADVILLAWMATARTILPLADMRPALQDLWSRHESLLAQPGPLAVVRTGAHLDILPLDSAVACVRHASPSGICVWPLPASISELKSAFPHD